jgi:N-acetylneuraminate synthase/N,N'-diacetyllegionaminate synthase
MLVLDDRRIGADQPCYVIAEAGVNHNGRVDVARRLIDAAADAGADAIKFQTFDPQRIATADAPLADYQRQAVGDARSQRQMLAALALSEADHHTLAAHCRERRITFLSSPFDIGSADLLASLDVAAIKLGSGELTNLPLLRHAATLGRPLLISTGMATLDEVACAIEAVRAAGGGPMALLHGVSAYPADPAEANLLAIGAMAARFDLPVGWSDHCPTIAVALAAAALGACVIEKHLTLDRTMAGPDHRASTAPAEFADMVRQVRDIRTWRGDGAKRPMPGETEMRSAARRSIVTATPVPAGSVLTAEMLDALRPGHGISPMQWDRVVGRRAKDEMPAGHRLDWSDLA